MVSSPFPEFGHEIHVFDVVPVVLESMEHLVFDVVPVVLESMEHLVFDVVPVVLESMEHLVFDVVPVVLESIGNTSCSTFSSRMSRYAIDQLSGGVSDDRSLASAAARSWRFSTRRISSGLL
ncbi:hypothetical protein HLRTI_003345 [Halorhabdus tiamatea SARL4B]|uniref:Uncharacterized protein n=1 Tax=Halorhabdus tiamatea SARL4B TaxID=1033806 RepID=U2F2T6_9EURY|nr:hypothetical protein HLRTI_003345 [Halorhabdus tiamatea SARL4B]